LPGAGGAVLPREQAHATARTVAETGRFLPGTPEFEAAFEKAKIQILMPEEQSSQIISYVSLRRTV
jgi:hypothetical protein